MKEPLRRLASLFLTTFFMWCQLSAVPSIGQAGRQAEDQVTFFKSKEEKRILVYGTKDGKWENGWISRLLRADENTLSIGNFTEPKSSSLLERIEGKVIAYSKGHIPVLKKHSWDSSSNDIVTIAFPPAITIDLAVWIITTPPMRDGKRVNYEKRKQGILDYDCAHANDIWFKEGHGLNIKCHIEDRTGDSFRINQRSANEHFLSTPFDCEEHAASIKQIGFTEGRLNIYYVHLVHLQNEPKARAVWCDNIGDIVAIGLSASDEALAHELGHAFSLDHVNDWAPPDCKKAGSPSNTSCLFDDDNLMYMGGSTRHYLTEGQVFRVFYNENSALNLVYKLGVDRSFGEPQPGQSCWTIPKDESERIRCPAINLRLWPDGKLGASK